MSVYILRELALWTIDSNRYLDVCSLCALWPCTKYGFIERYSGFNCVSRYEIRWKSRRVFPDCQTLMPRTARSNVAPSMLRRS
jgi:hypothetical protein